jgi:acyl-homoserine lactone acylase PvdQ
MYGVIGNSYAIVGFGKVQSAIHYEFGESADPSSPHYFHQASLYAVAKFEYVSFYKKDVEKHMEHKCHRGE